MAVQVRGRCGVLESDGGAVREARQEHINTVVSLRDSPDRLPGIPVILALHRLRKRASERLHSCRRLPELIDQRGLHPVHALKQSRCRGFRPLRDLFIGHVISPPRDQYLAANQGTTPHRTTGDRPLSSSALLLLVLISQDQPNPATSSRTLTSISRSLGSGPPHPSQHDHCCRPEEKNSHGDQGPSYQDRTGDEDGGIAGQFQRRAHAHVLWLAKVRLSTFRIARASSPST